jgi:hypothetical protein
VAFEASIDCGDKVYYSHTCTLTEATDESDADIDCMFTITGRSKSHWAWIRGLDTPQDRLRV